MGLDADAFRDIGIDGSLREESDIILLAGFFLKDADKLGSDDLALLLRITDAGQLIQEAVHGIHIDQVGVHLITEDFDHLFGLTFAKETMIDMNGDQLPADCPDEQRSHNRAVHTAGERQQDFFVADLGTDRFHLLIDESPGQFGSSDSLHAFGPFVVIHVHPPICLIE